MRRTTRNWSSESRIWKPSGSPASRQWARSIRCARPWKVPTHIPRTGTPSSCSMRPRISPAALLVKVTASTPQGVTRPVSTSQATR